MVQQFPDVLQTRFQNNEVKPEPLVFEGRVSTVHLSSITYMYVRSVLVCTEHLSDYRV